MAEAQVCLVLLLPLSPLPPPLRLHTPFQRALRKERVVELEK